MGSAIRFGLLIIVLSAIHLHAADKVAAVVNGDAISVAEVESALKQIPQPAMPISAIQKRQQRAEMLQVMIDDKLVRQYLRQHGAEIKPMDVERQFVALEASQKAIGKTLEDYLKEMGLTAAQVKENFLRMLQLAKYVDTQATPERLRAYYDANRDMFDGTTVRTSHIVIRFGREAAIAERQKAAEKLRAVRGELAAGKLEFAAAAKKYSQCPSATKGGDMGYMVRKFQADEAYARAAFALKTGEVSDVVETENGVHLIWVTDRKQGKASRYDDAAADVRECFEAELKQSLLTELRKRAKIEIKVKE
jgi:parvulin-like peptidyl-prolyl isomerase